MRLNPDSPELTAYVLGELNPATAEQLEIAVAAEPALLAEVEAIRATSLDVLRAFAAENSTDLSPAQRDLISQTAAASPPTVPTRRSVPREPAFRAWRERWVAPYGWGVLLAGATAVALTFTLWPRPQPNADDGFAELRYQKADKTKLPVAISKAPQSAGPVTVVEGNAARTESAPSPPASTDAAVASRPVRPPSRKEVRAPGPQGESTLRGDVNQAAPIPVNSPAPMEPALMKRYGLQPAQGPQSTVPSPEASPRGRFLASESEVHLSDAQSGHPTEGMRRPTIPFPERPLVQPRVAGEGYALIVANPFRAVSEAPLSTFSLDVDTASYANIRRFLREGSLPPPNAVRLEEMVNYFRYDAPPMVGEHPVVAKVEVAECPWKPEHRLVRVIVKAREVVRSERPRANLVFLVDVSGSMEPENKLPLVQRSLRLLTERLTARDSVSIVTYAGDAGIALPPSNGGEKAPILAAIERLKAGGSTHGSAGIRTAYELARTNFIKDGINRVILCTDGDFNVGLTSREDLLGLISEQARSGVFLSVLGYGMGNYQDATTELLADKGNGNYAYIDSFREAQKVLGEQLESTLVTVARDVKLQLEFNPERVVQWRLLGYENRLLADRDFNDDTKDAGELGAGHLVTALYELVPVGGIGPGVDPLRYQAPTTVATPVKSGHPDELLQLKLRYKLPDGGTSRMFHLTVKDDVREWTKAGSDLKFSAAVAGFGMLLRNEEAGGSLNYDLVLKLAEQGLGGDREGYRGEFIDLVRRARQLSGK